MGSDQVLIAVPYLRNADEEMHLRRAGCTGSVLYVNLVRSQRGQTPGVSRLVCRSGICSAHEPQARFHGIPGGRICNIGSRPAVAEVYIVSGATLSLGVAAAIFPLSGATVIP